MFPEGNQLPALGCVCHPAKRRAGLALGRKVCAGHRRRVLSGTCCVHSPAPPEMHLKSLPAPREHTKAWLLRGFSFALWFFLADFMGLTRQVLLEKLFLLAVVILECLSQQNHRLSPADISSPCWLNSSGGGSCRPGCRSCHEVTREKP